MEELRYFLTDVRCVNEPSIIDFIEETYKAKRSYFYFNRSLFHIRDPMQPQTSHSKEEDQLAMEVMTQHSEKMHSHLPNIRIFVSGIIGKMRQSRESQVMMIL